MKREEQLKFCKSCKKQKFDTKLGVICSLTSAQADFEDHCENYDIDEAKKMEVELKDGQNEIFNNLAGSWRRFANHLLDIVFFYIFLVIFMFTLALVSPGVLRAIAEVSGINYLVSFTFFILYFVILESTLGRTFGKMITKTYVIDEHGNKPSIDRILLRTICRFIPFDAFSFLASGDSGWHDMFSKTHVVLKK